jgi:hypothetical protein
MTNEEHLAATGVHKNAGTEGPGLREAMLSEALGLIRTYRYPPKFATPDDANDFGEQLLKDMDAILEQALAAPPGETPCTCQSDTYRSPNCMIHGVSAMAKARPAPADGALRDQVRKEIDGLMDNAQYDCVTNRVVAVNRILALTTPTAPSEGAREELVRSVSRASRRIWALSAPEHGMMMTRADDCERIMREEILGETFSSSPLQTPEPPQGEAGA